MPTFLITTIHTDLPIVGLDSFRTEDLITDDIATGLCPKSIPLDPTECGATLRREFINDDGTDRWLFSTSETGFTAPGALEMLLGEHVDDYKFSQGNLKLIARVADHSQQGADTVNVVLPWRSFTVCIGPDVLQSKNPNFRKDVEVWRESGEGIVR